MLERLFQKIFVAISASKNGYDIQTLVVKNKKILHKESRHFEGDSPSDVMIRYINDVIDTSPFFYISTLNLHANQGAYEGCSKPSERLQNQDVVGIQTLCRDNAWTQYASQEALYQLRTHYGAIGLDFIFSPFSMIEVYFADKIKNSFALYAFGVPEFFSVAIFDGGKLEYAHHYATGSSQSIGIDEQEVSEMVFSSPSLDDESAEGSIVLDDIEDLEDLDLLDDFDALTDIADLDELDEVSEFSEDAPTPEEKRSERDRNSSVIKSEVDGSSEEYQRFEFIQKTLERFYASNHCHGRFIETVCIADSSGGSELKRYLEEELFLNVLIRKVDVCEGINILAQAEEEGL